MTMINCSTRTYNSAFDDLMKLTIVHSVFQS